MRAAISNLFGENNLVEPPLWEVTLKRFFFGVRRKTRRDRLNGVEKPTEGKSPMSLALYRDLALAFLKNPSPRQFAHTYMVLTWNLMCRSENTRAMRLDHFAWEEDSLAIVLPLTKSDQQGSRKSTSDPKHVYANPLMPEVC